MAPHWLDSLIKLCYAYGRFIKGAFMTLDELFPREKFPLRARTRAQIPEKNITLEMAIFYQNPFSGDTGQNFSAATSFFVGNTKLFCSAIRTFAENAGEELYLQKENEQFFPASAEEMDRTFKEKAEDLEEELNGAFKGDPASYAWEQF